MKAFRKLYLVAALAVTGLIAAPSISKGTIILGIFTNNLNFDFIYGSFNNPGAVTPGPNFLTIQSPATPSGGGGIFVSPPISFDHTDPTNAYVELVARRRPENQAAFINVILRDDDSNGGTDYQDWVYSFGASLFSTTSFTTNVLPINNPSFVNNYGSPDGSINFDTGGGLTVFQIQGNFANDIDTLAIEIYSVRIVPEPSTVTLLLAGGLAAGLRARRMRRADAAIEI